MASSELLAEGRTVRVAAIWRLPVSKNEEIRRAEALEPWRGLQGARCAASTDGRAHRVGAGRRARRASDDDRSVERAMVRCRLKGGRTGLRRARCSTARRISSSAAAEGLSRRWMHTSALSGRFRGTFGGNSANSLDRIVRRGVLSGMIARMPGRMSPSRAERTERCDAFAFRRWSRARWP